MSDTVAVALISAVGAVIVALLGVQNVRIGRIRRDAAETREQVANNHVDENGKPINLREEADERHIENAGKLDLIIKTQVEHGEAIAALQTSDEEHDDRIEQIERTWPRSRFKPPARHRGDEP
ncbi:hypothetical protein [Leifsonia aquatica]|uniref:hypothetical protein n=1 Tax=Leifsonia aquatica TaxID=144185 RepID=UPI003829CB8D